MIRIHHNDIDSIASRWADGLFAFLTDDKMRSYETLYYQLCTHTDYNAVTDAVKNKAWRWIKLLLSHRDNFIGDRAFFKNGIDLQNKYYSNHPLKKVIKKLFDKIYGEYSALVAYEIFENLKLKTCPYCNRHYTFTIASKRGKFKTRPEFDHFYDKASYPFFAITFFNLIPSCKECNHGKGNNPCGVNPYFDDFNAKFIITHPEDKKTNNRDPKENKMNLNEIFKISRKDEFDVDFDTQRTNESKNIETLGLRPLYNEHKDYIMEIVDKVSAYNVLARDGIVDRFQGLYHTEADVYNLIFGRYLSDAELHNRPLSKLTADILDQLNIR